ncbi:hypothetical protein VTN77DRAFT_4802 [Rasamsonia byssochlamydoides]|uniref:uncharacterized protein n=1 Tax=Rasamsonia byssochlamydoides TaxID=89139 RepID=UPI0037422AD0
MPHLADQLSIEPLCRLVNRGSFGWTGRRMGGSLGPKLTKVTIPWAYPILQPPGLEVRHAHHSSCAFFHQLLH